MRWNPDRMKFDASRPMPDLAARWRGDQIGQQTSDDASSSSSSSLRGIARVMLGRARQAVEVFLGLGTPGVEGARSAPMPFDDVAPGTLGMVVPPEAMAMAPGAMPPLTIALDRPMPADRVVLPMSSGGVIRPGDQARITSRPQNAAFRPERIVIGGNPSDWIVNEIKVGRRSQLCDAGDIPGVVFATDAEDAGVRLDVVRTSQNFTMDVTYVGPNPDGEPFTCGVMGNAFWTSPSAASDEADTSRIYLPLSSGVVAILPNTTAAIHARPQDPFRPERIIIGGDPGDWIINDIKVGMRSQLAQSGDIPGLVFSATSRGTEISFETVQIAMDFCLVVTYVGDKPEGEPLLACAIGSVPA